MTEPKISKPEPPPKNRGSNVYTSLCCFLTYSNLDDPCILDLLEKRHNFGIQKYGQPLMTHDGRDDLEDARQEIGDFLQYVTNP